MKECNKCKANVFNTVKECGICGGKKFTMNKMRELTEPITGETYPVGETSASKRYQQDEASIAGDPNPDRVNQEQSDPIDKKKLTNSKPNQWITDPQTYQRCVMCSHTFKKGDNLIHHQSYHQNNKVNFCITCYDKIETELQTI